MTDHNSISPTRLVQPAGTQVTVKIDPPPFRPMQNASVQLKRDFYAADGFRPS